MLLIYIDFSLFCLISTHIIDRGGDYKAVLVKLLSTRIA